MFEEGNKEGRKTSLVQHILLCERFILYKNRILAPCIACLYTHLLIKQLFNIYNYSRVPVLGADEIKLNKTSIYFSRT